MKLVIAIVHRDDADPLLEALMREAIGPRGSAPPAAFCARATPPCWSRAGPQGARGGWPSMATPAQRTELAIPSPT